MELAELAVRASERWLKPGGALVVKLFQGEGVEDWTANLRKKFSSVRNLKPRSSRPDSRELYVVAEQFRSG
jgi:23S rRNA (uridine2552-2'-O)-methyltransferase